MSDKADQRLNRRPEIAALPHQQIKILPKQWNEIEARRLRCGAARNPAIGLAAADGGGNIWTGQTWRGGPAQILVFAAPAAPQPVAQTLRTRTGPPAGR